GVFLRLLMDTAARPIEIWRLKWADVDPQNSCITITPAKYSQPKTQDKQGSLEPAVSPVQARRIRFQPLR
ncbi:MAG: hypothetical protein QXO50_04360, partial [Candidatus Bathyarchaeia archaeon]